MITLFSICSVFFIIINITSAQNPCKTPDNWDGNCIVLQECQSLYRLLTGSVSTAQRTFLRNSRCGGDGGKIFVCCPNTFTVNDLPPICGVEVADRIHGGEKTSINELPWMALLHYRKPNGRGGFFCGSTLIHERYVITAAHCIRDQQLVRNQYTIDSVRFGENDLRTNPDCQQDDEECADPVVNIAVAELIVHENYVPSSRSQENDIALIRLQRAAPYTDYIRPICLPLGKLKDKNFDGMPLKVAGFGRTENASRSDVKLKLGVNGFNLNQCSNIYQAMSRVNLDDGNRLCAGGPLVAEQSADETYKDPFSYLVGVVSIGPKFCGTPGIPGVYTRVDKYIDWILDHMKK